MTNAQDRAADGADRSGLVGPEGELKSARGRADIGSARPSRPPRYRLKRSLELFPASDGVLYLLRTGAEADFVLRNPSASDRLLLKMLERSYASVSELESGLRTSGLSVSADLGAELERLHHLGVLERQAAEPLPARKAERYHRQLIYFSDLAPAGASAEGAQRRLEASRVVILGTGGLGCWAGAALACAGVGSLLLIDDDRVELGNLHRQLLFRESDLGRLKVEAAAEALRAHNSEVAVETVCQRIRGEGELKPLIADAEILLATADWPPYELARWVNRACIQKAVPYLTAGQFPPLLRVGPLVIPGHSACLECLERATRREFPLYDELAAFRRHRPTSASTFGAAAGLIGTMLASESIHLLTGLCRPASVDRSVCLDMRTMRVSEETVRRDPECPECGGCPDRGLLDDLGPPRPSP